MPPSVQPVQCSVIILVLAYLQGCGRPSLAVQWGTWGGGGMAVRNDGFMQRMERVGLGIGGLVTVQRRRGSALR